MDKMKRLLVCVGEIIRSKGKLFVEFDSIGCEADY